MSYYSLLAKSLNEGLHYFGLTYRANSQNNFTDCTHNYDDNRNLFAVYLPPRCLVKSVFPQTSLSLSTTSWANTDLTYKLSLSQLYHVFIRYQFTIRKVDTYAITRLVINSVIQPHTMTIRGNSGNIYGTLFGFWQGSLSVGIYQITVQHRGGASFTYNIFDDYLTRAMDIIYCY